MQNLTNNNSTNNNKFATGASDSSSGGFDFVYENTKHNNKRDKKSHNFKTVAKIKMLIENRQNNKAGVRNHDDIKTDKTDKTDKDKTKRNYKSKSDLEKTQSRVLTKASLNTTVYGASIDYDAAYDDAYIERDAIECEQLHEDFVAWLKEDRQKLLDHYQESYEKWSMYRQSSNDENWSKLVEDLLKQEYDEYNEDVIALELEIESEMPVTKKTRTITEYEADEQKKLKAIEQRKDDAAWRKKVVEEAWLDTGAAKNLLTVEECMADWYEKTLSDALKMNAAKKARDERIEQDSDCPIGRNLQLYNAIKNAQRDFKKAWLKEQFETAAIMDNVLSKDDDRFVSYMTWHDAMENIIEDVRYVAWAKKILIQRKEYDECAEAYTVAEAYDELPLHERYSWCSDISDESDEDELDDDESC